MFGANALVIVAFYIGIPILVAYVLYLLIRTAVRDGILAAQDRSAASLAEESRRTSSSRTSDALARDDRAEAGPPDQHP
ncbi:hypothetical protein [Cellulomonas sp.]|uniref:hypothetical protein n=1 Tax=Cellulomonas sp. TaxID=40001 RepID=UPI003BA9AB92